MAYDDKYGVITAERGNIVHGRSGVPLNESDEPVFIIRAQDVIGPAAVLEYAKLAELIGATHEHVDAVREVVKNMQYWRRMNPNLVKVPD